MVVDIHPRRPLHYTMRNRIVLGHSRFSRDRKISHRRGTFVLSWVSEVVALFTISQGCLLSDGFVQTCNSVLEENSSR